MNETIINGIDVNEEIIIDKVNVAECKYLICDRLHNCECKAECDVYPETVSYDDCKGINCYFKQLKRLQEENEELKQQLEIDKNQINYFIEENEGLKKQLEFSRTHKTVLDAERIKYKQALQEIEEELVTAGHCEMKECGCDDCKECLECTTKMILEKINEVLNDRMARL